MTRGPLTLNQLRSGHAKAVSTSIRLLEAGMEVMKTHPEIALGLLQIGQEELGKSFSFLAAASYSERDSRRDQFWSDWTNHQVKAHRAFLYELICTLRVEIEVAPGRRISGEPTRAKIQHEKEAAFYTDFDSSLGGFVAPQEVVQTFETYNRGLAVCFLGNTALGVKTALDGVEPDRSFRGLGGLVYRLMSEQIYQEDMPGVWAEFAARTPWHADLVSRIDKALPASTVRPPRDPEQDTALPAQPNRER